MAKYNDSVKLVIKCNQTAADSMLPLLKELKYMGSAGCSRGIKIEDYDGNHSFGFDGDGPDRIDSIELDGELVKSNIEEDGMRILRKGAAGTRGVPDGSGPDGKGPTGLRLGGCPKREDFDDDAEYKKAMLRWKEKNQPVTKAKYTRREGGPGNYKYFYGASDIKAATMQKEDRTMRSGKRKAMTWDNDVAQAYVDKNYGKPFSVGGKKFKVGDRATSRGKPAQVVASYGNEVIVYDYGLGNVITVNPKQVKVDKVKKSHTEGKMNMLRKSGLTLVVIPGELSKAAKLSAVGSSHPAGLSGVSGKTKSKIPYTGHAERMKLAKMAAERMMAPKPEDEGKYADTPIVDRKDRVKGEKPPYSKYSTGVSGMGSQAHGNFGRATLIVKPSEIGTSTPEGSTAHTPISNVSKPRK